MNKKILKILEKSGINFSKKNIDDNFLTPISIEQKMKNFTIQDFINSGFKSEKSKLINSLLGNESILKELKIMEEDIALSDCTLSVDSDDDDK